MLLSARANCFSLRVTGAILNAAAIVIGGIIGLIRPQSLSAQTQIFFKMMLGSACLFFGLRLTWLNVGGSFLMVVKQLVIALLALTLGHALGKGIGLQKLSNRLGQYARKLIEANRPNDPHRFSNGMNACAILFCAAPLGILGAIHDGLSITDSNSSYFYPLAIKGLMDGLAMMGFVVMFGFGALLSALPVFVFLGTITMVTHVYLEPLLARPIIEAIHAVGGLVICTVGVVIFEIRRVQLADYLPALIIAPLLAWIWK